MTQSFQTTALAGDRALVSGVDDAGTRRQVILDATEYNRLAKHVNQLSAGQAFDDAVEAFFAPISQALDQLAEASRPKRDPAFFVVLNEGTPGQPAEKEEVVYLDRETAILRLINSGDTSRLLWIGDSIEILEQPAEEPLPEENSWGQPTPVDWFPVDETDVLETEPPAEPEGSPYWEPHGEDPTTV